MKVSREVLKGWSERLIRYYENTDPFDEYGLKVDTIRLSDGPLRIYRVLCSCAYLGRNDLFVGGTLTKDILRVTGWKMPVKATTLQLEEDKVISEKLEKKCREYISHKRVTELIKKQGLELPVEWRMFYVMYVPRTAFTAEELSFMEKNPCWMLPLADNPPLLRKEEKQNEGMDQN